MDSLDDLQGMKIRVNPTDPLIEAWSALGAQPTTFAWKEIYTGLQLGAIDGLLNEPEWIYRMRFHEVAPHIGLSEHDITVRLMTLSGKTLDRLSATQLFAFVGLIAYQILSRNLSALPVIYWSEELARFSFQWSIAIGTALGVLHADHFVLHAFRPGRRADRLCRLIAELAMFGLALYLMIYGYEFADSGWHRTSTAGTEQKA